MKPIDPMSEIAAAQMEEYAESIRSNAREVIRARKKLLQSLNDQRTEE
jgi:hypothetical protein